MLAFKSNDSGIDPALDERLDRLAQEQQRPKQFIIDEALGEYLLREEDRMDTRRELAERIAEFERTGLHLTNDEVMDWLDRLANGEDVPPPKCHT